MLIKEGPWEEGGNAKSMWMRKATCILKMASEEFGVTRGSRSDAKIPGGGTLRSKRLLRKRRTVSDAYI